MYINYISPVDSLPRARKVQSYREAGLVMATLEAMGADPQAEDNWEMAKETALPLLASAWQPCYTLIQQADHFDEVGTNTDITI